jgi:hypothetical protein
MLIIPAALRKLMKEDFKFKTSLGYMVRPCLNTLPSKKYTNKGQTKKNIAIHTLKC